MKKLHFLLMISVAGLIACNDASHDEKPVTDGLFAVDSSSVKTGAPKGYIHHFEDTALENRITEALLKLPFIQKSNAYIDSFSNHSHGITFMMDSTENMKNAISVHAGYNGDQRFETYYQFYVNPDNLDIQVYDAVADKTMTVKEYMQKTKKN